VLLRTGVVIGVASLMNQATLDRRTGAETEAELLT
jgi:hypothetical protein